MRTASFALLICITLPPSAHAEASIRPEQMGLSKTSVFDAPTPTVYRYGATPPGQSRLLPRAYLGAPPQIPHDIADFLPITAQNNLCIACHAQPEQWGKQREAGAPTPIPATHYTDRRVAPDRITDHLIAARYNCNQCHVPQSDAPALVENTFRKKR